MAVDLRAVAELSGVSVSTVSRALRGSPRVNSRTRAKVLRAAESLNYRPNAAARGLRTRQSQLVGVVIPNLVSVTFVNLFSHLQAGFRAHGYETVLSVTNGEPEQELAAFATLLGHQIDGVIAIGSYSVSTDFLRESRLPAVHLFNAPDQPAGDCVTINEFESTQDAIGHLISHGHRRIGCIDGSSEPTVAGYEYAVRKHDLPMDPQLLHLGKYDTETGTEGVDKLVALDDPPTAIFFGCYENWLSGIPRLLEHGLTIPDQMSVVCRDDAEMLRWWRPSISAVDVQVPAIAKLAVDRLVDAMATDEGALTEQRHGKYQVATTLIKRHSVADPPRR
ncbi:LacI family DNA-binding transcriptional regulator [Mycolicibacterium mengxianglii]|uniref:LacI family DNA-binding transcriptional regulator n=1 Tax=Mycolicibacterium mengxianglii TaxID=2736649 RepID=UPI0018D19F1F|nr:LacI family DNA-binding transcriptional regulator [Mycolicibacterium mengxianglii]